MHEFLEFVFWGNTVKSYLFFIGAFVGGFLLLFIIKKIVLIRLLKRAKKSQTNVDETIVRGIIKYLVPVLYFAVFYFSIRFLHLDDTVARVIDIVFTAWALFFGALLISRIFVCFFNTYWEKKHENTEKMSVKWLTVVIKIVVWIAALMLFLDNIGVEVTALIAGLGIGGIAVAFAAQSILEDIFSFVTIFFDRPFEIGDFIIVDDLMGTVEHTGIKTTRIRSLSGEQLVLPNKDITNSRLKNYKRMENRRIAFQIGVTYDTPLVKLKEIPLIIKDIINNVEGVSFDRSHFSEFADFSLNFSTVYYVLNSDYGVYMDVQQEINFRIAEEFQERSIEFAFPTQTLYVNGISGSQRQHVD